MTRSPAGAARRPAGEGSRSLAAGLVLLLGFVYLVFEFVAAAAWVDPPYDWARNYISDLGFSDCAVVEGIRLCSPLHGLMNAGLVVQGTVFSVGGLLVTGLLLPEGALRGIVRALMVASGIGTALVGVFHLSLALTASGLGWVHFAVAAVAIGPGNVGVLLLGLGAMRQPGWRGYGVSVAVIGAAGLVAGVLLLAGTDLGVGIGAVERVAVYPLNVWTIGTGVGLVVLSASDGLRRRARRAGTSPNAGTGTTTSTGTGSNPGGPSTRRAG